MNCDGTNPPVSKSAETNAATPTPRSDGARCSTEAAAAAPEAPGEAAAASVDAACAGADRLGAGDGFAPAVFASGLASCATSPDFVAFVAGCATSTYRCATDSVAGSGWVGTRVVDCGWIALEGEGENEGDDEYEGEGERDGERDGE